MSLTSALFFDKAHCFRQSECALYGNFIAFDKERLHNAVEINVFFWSFLDYTWHQFGPPQRNIQGEIIQGE